MAEVVSGHGGLEAVCPETTAARVSGQWLGRHCSVISLGRTPLARCINQSIPYVHLLLSLYSNVFFEASHLVAYFRLHHSSASLILRTKRFFRFSFLARARIMAARTWRLTEPSDTGSRVGLLRFVLTALLSMRGGSRRHNAGIPGVSRFFWAVRAQIRAVPSHPHAQEIHEVLLG